MATNNVIINRNIQNATHSTGPRTDEGKAIASQNSLKHGLASGTLLIPGEDPAAYEALVADFIAQHQGTVTFESTPAKTYFSILLPVKGRDE